MPGPPGGVRHECPVRVDMPHLQAEFLSHCFIKHRACPRAQYALGLITWEARLATLGPPLANCCVSASCSQTWGRRLVGVLTRCKPPPFVPGPSAPGSPVVSTTTFIPRRGDAAHGVLESAGCHRCLRAETSREPGERRDARSAWRGWRAVSYLGPVAGSGWT